jgi:hypothetical protein
VWAVPDPCGSSEAYLSRNGCRAGRPQTTVALGVHFVHGVRGQARIVDRDGGVIGT